MFMHNAYMTDTSIREFFGLDQSANLDTPRANLGFRSYREAAQAYFEKWGAQ